MALSVPGSSVKLQKGTGREKIAPIGVPWSLKIFLSLLPFPFQPLPSPSHSLPSQHTPTGTLDAHTLPKTLNTSVTFSSYT